MSISVVRREYQESSTAASPLVITLTRFSMKQARALCTLRSITCALTNQRRVFRSRDQSRPIKGHLISLDQSEESNQVT